MIPFNSKEISQIGLSDDNTSPRDTYHSGFNDDSYMDLEVKKRNLLKNRKNGNKPNLRLLSLSTISSSDDSSRPNTSSLLQNIPHHPPYRFLRKSSSLSQMDYPDSVLIPTVEKVVVHRGVKPLLPLMQTINKATVSESLIENRLYIISNYERESEDTGGDGSSRKDVSTDKYGFLQPELKRTKSIHSVLVDKKLTHRWNKIIDNWDVYNTFRHNKLVGHVCKGIPDRFRGAVWKLILKVGKQLEANVNLYETLKVKAMGSSNDVIQIDKDVDRTFKSHVLYNLRYGPKQRSLFNVLVTYSSYDKIIGYTQGMSDLAGLILMYMDEEDAFWAFRTILLDPRHSMHGFYIDNMPKLRLLLDHFDNIMQKQFPTLHTHFIETGYDPSIICTRWFMTVFINGVPFELLLRIWDIFLLKGTTMMIPIAYTIIRYHARELKKMNIDQIAVFFGHGILSIKYDIEMIVEQIVLNVRELKRLGFYPIPGLVPDCVSLEGENNVSTSSSAKSTPPLPESPLSRKSSVGITERHSIFYKRSMLRSNSMAVEVSESISDASVDNFPKFLPPVPLRTWEEFSNSLRTNSETLGIPTVNNQGEVDIQAIIKLIKATANITTISDSPVSCIQGDRDILIQVQEDGEWGNESSLIISQKKKD